MRVVVHHCGSGVLPLVSGRCEQLLGASGSVHRCCCCLSMAQVKMINTSRKDFSTMSMLALEHISHICETQGEEYKPQLVSLGTADICCAPGAL